MGRPSKLTPARRLAIVERIAAGATPEVAAECEGVDGATHYRWMQRGASEEEGDYRDYREAVTRARAEQEQAMLADIRDALTPGEHGGPDWRAKAWYLERTQRGRYGASLDVSAKVEDALERAIERLRAELDPATFERVVRILAGEGGEAGAGEGGGEPTEH